MEKSMGNKFKIMQVVVILAVLVALAGPAGTAIGQMGGRVHPLLSQIAEKTPEQRVAVIVQKSGHTTRAEDLARALGGQITKDLHIINAFVVELAASAAVELAQDASVNWASLDAPVVEAGKPAPTPSGRNYYLDTLGVRQLWNMGLQGAGIGVAVIDSGISPSQDFSTLKRSVSFNPSSTTVQDVYGHGTHIAGIIAGNGTMSGGYYQGIAPGVSLLNLKVCDEQGRATESDVVAAMQWVYDNRQSYNIRVVNISLNSTVEQSYHTSPMDAAAEILWFNKIVVVVSAGNFGTLGINPANAAPANDPFVITVGASDERATTKRTDDTLAAYTAYTLLTLDGFKKPDILAPGQSVYSVLSFASSWDDQYPNRCDLNCAYFRLSGTSMAAPMVTGSVALLLQDEPNLTPDQVKYRLLNTGSTIWSGIIPFPYLNTYAAVTGSSTLSANTGIAASQLLWSGTTPVNWTSVNWGSVNWGSVNWGSVNWGSVNWGSVNWGSTYWGR